MAVVTTNLGPVTAYGDAVRGGYTGTKEQWEALMADYGTIGTQAQQDAQTASTAAQTATTKASEASASATQAQQAAASVSTPDTTLTQSGKAADAKATGDAVAELKEDFTDMVNSAYVTDSASGGIAHFVDGADNVPVKSLKVNIEPVQSGSGDPSPENDRPISGWDSVKVTRTGKNLLPKYVINPPLYNGVTFTVNSDGSVNANGTASATCNASSADITGIDGEVALSGCPSDGSATTYQIWIYDKTANASTAIVDTGNGSTGTLIKDHVYSVRIRIQSGYTVDKTFYPMLRLASDTDGTYEPYNGNTYNISLSSAGTVYGGTLDVVSGELVVDKAIVNLGTLNWTYESTLPRFYTSGLANDIRLLVSNDDVVDGVSSMYKVVSFNNLYVTGKQNGTMAVSTTKAVSVINTDYTDATSFKTAMNGQMFVYPLATPLTYQLSATEVKSLLGINNVWSDAGDIDVEYRADTKLFIERLTAPDSADMIADANITSGKYFMVGNNLYKATANIANGAQIIVGTNCISKSLSEALNEINA